MSSMIDAFIMEMEQEAKATKRVLERVPEDKFDWKPHEKSLTIGQLAMHIATLPKSMADIMKEDKFEMGESPGWLSPGSVDELLSALDDTVKETKEIFESLGDDGFASDWTMIKEGKEVMRVPRMVMTRQFVLNHWYHHRGQMQVYLRLLDVPVPSIYGPTADENPFADL